MHVTLGLFFFHVLSCFYHPPPLPLCVCLGEEEAARSHEEEGNAVVEFTHASMHMCKSMDTATIRFLQSR